jgi:hypothetical protein
LGLQKAFSTVNRMTMLRHGCARQAIVGGSIYVGSGDSLNTGVSGTIQGSLVVFEGEVGDASAFI